MTQLAMSIPKTPAVPKTPAAASGRRLHPLAHAGLWIGSDLFSTLMFVGLYALTHSAFLATLLAIVAGVIQIGALKLRRRPVDLMQWASLGLVVVFGTASLLTRDPRFIMLKPTLIYAAIGVVMLRRGWMNRYMSEVVLTWSADVIQLFGYLWAALMFAAAGVNLVLASQGDLRAWTWFLAVFPIGSKVALVSIQYVATRVITVARVRRASAGAR